MILLLVAIVAIPLLTLFLFKNHKKSDLPPGPPGLPYVGNFFQFDPITPHIYLWKLSLKYGPIFYMKLGKIPVIVISTPKLAKEVLKIQDLAFCGRPKEVGSSVMSYNGLDIGFTTYNDSWRELRKICVLQVLSNKQVSSFRPVRLEELSVTTKKILSKARSGQSIDLTQILMSFTATFIARAAFGKRYDEEGSAKFHRLMVETQAMLRGPFFADYLPLFGWVDKVSGMTSRLDKIFKEMDEFYQELIDEHLNKTAKSLNPNLLDLLIQLKSEKSCPVDLTWGHVKALIMDVLVAGTDTSAATLVWGMTALIKNPETMKKLQKETREIMGEKELITEEDLPKLPYLKAVVKEILRLFPPAPLLVPRETLEDTVLDGYKIPAKTNVYVNAWAIARDPDTWENANEFLPERFLNTKIDIIGQDIEVIPFGAGRRGCPGITMGLATVEFMLANLVYLFDWELPSGMKKEDIDMEVLPGITMHKKNSLCLVAKPYFK